MSQKDDLISRQAAFDIVENIRDRMSVEGYWAIVERLKHLPSAQPEVIRCKDCKFFKCEHKGMPYKSHDKWYCTRSANVKTKEDDFCSKAERRTE